MDTSSYESFARSFIQIRFCLPCIYKKGKLLSFKHIFSQYALPPNELWEYAWLFGSILPILFGYLAFPKNRVYLIRFSLIGTIVFGFVPVMMGCFLRAFELMDYYYTKNIRHEIFNFPFIVLLYIFFSIAFQIHCFELYFTFKLMAMWSRLSKKNAWIDVFAFRLLFSNLLACIELSSFCGT